MQQNCLCYEDGLDGIEAVENLEAAFQIKIENAEAVAIKTVGDLFDLIVAKCPPGETGKCASAMAFYRLRQALKRPDLAPSSSLAFLDQAGAKAVLKHLRDRTGLAVPQNRFARLGRIGCVVAWIGAILAFIIALTVARYYPETGFACVTGLVAVMAAGIIATRHDKGRLPAGCETLGGLARVTAVASYGELVKRGARARETEIWEIVTTTLAAFCRMPASAINRETTFYKSQTRQAA